jgi:hypothetical protein
MKKSGRRTASPAPSADVAFWSLVRAISTGDDATVQRELSDSPHLATATATVGASRSTSRPFFLVAIKHYLYAGDTALHIAAAAYRADVSQVLIQRGADPRATNRRGATPLHYAAAGGPGSAHWNPKAQADVVGLLVRAGADPNGADKSGVAPLHVAIRSRCAAAVGALLTSGADARRKNGAGSTPLHLAVQTTGKGGSGTPAAQEQQAAIVRLLIEHGARLADKNARGKRVAECVRRERLVALMGLPPAPSTPDE